METFIRLFELCYDWIAHEAFIFVLASIGVLVVAVVTAGFVIIRIYRKRS